MRKFFAVAIAGLALTACTSGTRIIVIRESPTQRPAPAQTPAPVPSPVRGTLDVEPLEITIGRPHRGYVFVHTNRPAYVALFEIIPDEGTSLVQPATIRQRRMVISGLARVPVWWGSSRPRTTRPAARGRAEREVRYIYAVAADRPIRLEPEVFRAGFFPRALGVSVYRARNPYVTMRALARRFVPDLPDARWAEDVYVYDSWRAVESRPVARVYCRGTVYEVPWELADRTWCPRPPHYEPDRVAPGSDDLVAALPEPAAPDSVKGDNGRRVQRRAHGDPQHRVADRVREPMPGEAEADPERPGQTQGGNEKPAETPGNQGRGQGQGRPDHAGPPESRPPRGGPPDSRPPRGGPPEKLPANPPANPPADPPVTVPAQTPVTTPGAGTPGRGQGAQGKPENTGRPADAGRPEKTGKPENPGNAENPGKPENAGKPEKIGKPENTREPSEPGRPDPIAKPAGPPAAAAKPQPAPPAAEKPAEAAKPSPGNGKPEKATPATPEAKGKQSPPGKAEAAPDSSKGQPEKGKGPPPGKGRGGGPPTTA